MIIDFHSHILPKADHGSNSVDVTRAQLAMMHQAGTDIVVATPHFYPNLDSVDRFLARRAHTARRLTEIERPDTPVVYLGAEVLVCEGIESMQGLETLTIHGTKVILLEMPFGRWNERLIETVLAVRARGFTPVLAHIDRYAPENVIKLLREGILAQVNAAPLVRFFGYRRNRAYIEGESVVALGSDLHKAEKNGYANFVKMQQKLGARAGEIFAKTEALLQGAIPIEHTVRKKEIIYT